MSLKPQSALAHTVLEGAYYAQGEIAAALGEGETALSLNPLDPFVVTVHAIRLVLIGQIDRGAALLTEGMANSIVVNSNFVDFTLFLVAYLKGDRDSASRYANLSLSDRHPLGMLARALVVAPGDRNRAIQLRDRLFKLYPAFRADPRQAIARFIPSNEIVDRLTHDLADLGE